MKCSNCGFDNVPGATFCGNCGAKLEQPVQDPFYSSVSINDTPKPEGHKGNTKKIVIIIAVIIACIGAVFGVKAIIEHVTMTPEEREYKKLKKELKSISSELEKELEEQNNIVFTIKDPSGHTINVKNDSIYKKRVDLSSFAEKEKELRNNAKLITSSEIDNLSVSESKKKALNRVVYLLKYVSYSHDSLVSRLTYEGVAKEDATYAADNAKIDFKEQALISALDLLASGKKSKEELKSRLNSDRFTDEQIDYAMSKSNPNFYEQAVDHALECRFFMEYDKERAKSTLKIYKYTEKEIDFALQTVYEKMN